ncbi:MCE family protein [Mycobacterium marseillense]|nr:MCE family protein [Mycobacterium marseillense]
MFQTITSIAEKVDPVKLNLTLSAAAQSLAGLGEKFGQSVVNANAVLDEVNPRMPQARKDIQQLAALGDTYANASPDLFDFLNNAVVTSRTINAQQKDLDQALLAAAGFGNTDLAHDQCAAKGFGSGVVGGGRVRQHRGRPVHQGRAVPGARRRRSGADRPTARHLQPRNLLPDAQRTRRLAGDGGGRGRLQRLLAEHGHRGALGTGADCEPGVRGARHRVPGGRRRRGGRRGAQPLHLAREPAPGERPRRPRGRPRMLAESYPRPVAGARTGDGHRQQHRALQPPGHRIAVCDRVRLGPPGRRQHHQPLADLPRQRLAQARFRAFKDRCGAISGMLTLRARARLE